jgi:hypothetical protein
LSEELETPSPLPPKTNKELALELKASIEADLAEQSWLEHQITKQVARIKGLKALEAKVLEADEVQRRIQSNLKELELLDRKEYEVENGLI